MVLRSLCPSGPHRLLLLLSFFLSFHPPIKSHTNFKSLITPDLGCFLAISQVRKSPSLSLLYVSCWGGEKEWDSNFLWGRKGETEQPIWEAGREGEKL